MVVYALAATPWAPHAVYAATAQGIYASGDGGATWRPAGRGFPGAGIEAWAVTALRGPADGALLASASNGALYRLERAATGWRRVATPPGSHDTYSLYGVPGTRVVLAGSDDGIARSMDGGRSWARVAKTPGGEVVAFARDAAQGILYAGVASLPYTLLTSRDGGWTWTVLAGASPPRNVVALLSAAGRVYAGVMGDPRGRAVWVGGAGGFTAASDGLPRDAHGMALALDGRRLLVGTMGVGVYGRDGQGRWAMVGRGLENGTITSLMVLPGRQAQATVLAGTDRGIYRLVASH
jgi:hypothetical protein